MHEEKPANTVASGGQVARIQESPLTVELLRNVAGRLEKAYAPLPVHARVRDKLARLVSEHLGITLGKGQLTVENWDRLPPTVGAMGVALTNIQNDLYDSLRKRANQVGHEHVQDFSCTLMQVINGLADDFKHVRGPAR